MPQTNKFYCDGCGKLLKDYDPQFCCSAFDCGCRGEPTNPPICSEKCWAKVMRLETGGQDD